MQNPKIKFATFSLVIVTVLGLIYALFIYDSKTAKTIIANSKDPELEKVFESFNSINNTSDPLRREYKLQKQAKDLNISVDNYRSLFEIYRKDKEYLPDYPQDKTSLLAWVHWFFVELSRKKRIELLQNGFFIALEKGVLITGAFALYKYFREAPIRKKQEHYQAWQMINSAIGQKGSGGRIEALQDLNKDKVSLKGLIARNAYLKGINLEKADLTEADLQEADFQAANLRLADLTEADLQEANLQGANLQGANLQIADLRLADLRLADLTEADLRLADLTEADLQAANLQGSDLQAANLQGANLQGADLRRANLQAADLQAANLQGADLRRANLQGSDLQGANLQGANLQGADRQEAHRQEAHRQEFQESDLPRSVILEFKFHELKKQKNNFQRTKRRIIHRRLAHLQDTKLRLADLQGADLQGADLRKVKNLTSEQLENSNNWDKAYYDPEVRECLGLQPEPPENTR